jgi:hypothetical protein
MSEEFATVEEAVSAVMSAYPDSAPMVGLSGLFTGTRVFYDPQRYKVSMIGDSTGDEVKPVVYVDYIDGVDITDSLDVYDVLNDESGRHPFDERTTDLMAAVDDVATIYIDSHTAKLREKEPDDERLAVWFHWQIERAIEVLRARMALLESVQLRFLRSVIEEETTPEGAERALDRLHVKPEALRDLVIADQRRYQRFEFPLRQRDRRTSGDDAR